MNIPKGLAALLFFFLIPAAPAKAGSLNILQMENPGLTVDLSVGLWAWPLPMDFDSDGDLDLVVSCPDTPYNGTYFFENTGGNVKMPVFKPPVRIGPGMPNVRVYYDGGAARVFGPRVEYDNFTKNVFSAPVDMKISPQKHSALFPTGRRIRFNEWSYADYNRDGRPDLVVGLDDWTDYGWDDAYDENGRWTNGPLHGTVYVALNATGSKRPTFGKPFIVEAGGAPAEVFGMPSPMFEDFDGDGDADLICGEFLDGFTWFENTGTKEKPVFAPGRPLEHGGAPIRMDLEMIVPTAVDWDGDGDVDIIVGQEDGRVALVENTDRSEGHMPVFLPPVFFKQQAGLLKFGVLATPVSFDWDGDGDEDIISGNSAGYIGFIENLGPGGGGFPRWAAPVYLEADGVPIRIMAGENGSIQGPAEAKWGYTTVSAADWDLDGLPDILANSILGEVVWFRNTGSRKSPKLAAARPVEAEWPGAPPAPQWNWKKPPGGQLITQWRTTPAVFDFTGDGLPDIVMLDHEGYLCLFERTGKPGALKLLPGKRVFIDAQGNPLQLNAGRAGKSGRRKIHITDWDGDGRPDILMDSNNVKFLRNTETRGGSIVLTDMGDLADEKLAGHDTSPAVVDWDGNGIPDLLIGAEDGHFYYMRNPREKQ